MLHTTKCIAVLIMMLAVRPAKAATGVEFRPLEQIPPGTHVGRNPPEGWSHLIMVSFPRVAPSDMDKVPSIARDMAGLLTVNIVANVIPVDLPYGREYRLDKVAMGLGTRIAGKNTIITSDTQEQLGANLGYIARQVLARSETLLKEARQIARTSNMSVFDVETLVLRNGGHRQMILRHVVLASRQKAALGTHVWLMEERPAGTYRLADRQLQLLPPSLQEDRVIHVNADEFVLGIPTASAFALARIPQGRPIAFTRRLKQMAPARQFTADTAELLERELWSLRNQ